MTIAMLDVACPVGCPDRWLTSCRDRCGQERPLLTALSHAVPDAWMVPWSGDVEVLTAGIQGARVLVLLRGFDCAGGPKALHRLHAALDAAAAAGVERVVALSPLITARRRRIAGGGEAPAVADPFPIRPEHFGARRHARLVEWAAAAQRRACAETRFDVCMLDVGRMVLPDGEVPSAAALTARQARGGSRASIPEGWINLIHVHDLAGVIAGSVRRDPVPRHLYAVGYGDEVSALSIRLAMRIGHEPATAFLDADAARRLARAGWGPDERKRGLPPWTPELVESLLEGCPVDATAAEALLGRPWTPIFPLLVQHARRVAAPTAAARAWAGWEGAPRFTAAHRRLPDGVNPARVDEHLSA